MPARMKPNYRRKYAWTFSSASSNNRVRWFWKRTDEVGNVLQESDHFHSLGAAMADARKNGFNEAYDQFVIV
jgi:hypothetical protein